MNHKHECTVSHWKFRVNDYYDYFGVSFFEDIKFRGKAAKMRKNLKFFLKKGNKNFTKFKRTSNKVAPKINQLSQLNPDVSSDLNLSCSSN